MFFCTLPFNFWHLLNYVSLIKQPSYKSRLNGTTAKCQFNSKNTLETDQKLQNCSFNAHCYRNQIFPTKCSLLKKSSTPRWDNHWMPTWSQCSPCTFRPNVILHFENLAEEEGWLRQELPGGERLVPTVRNQRGEKGVGIVLIVFTFTEIS